MIKSQSENIVLETEHRNSNDCSHMIKSHSENVVLVMTVVI